MKKKISVRELILFGILLTALVYYFFVQGPIANETEALNTQIDELQNQITISQSKLIRMNNMQETVDEAFAESAGTPNEIPAYNNLNEVITELNGLLTDTNEYSVSFGEDVISNDGVVRRAIVVSYRVGSYEQAKSIITAIESSSNRYLIQDESMTQTSAKGSTTYSVSISIICYEYVR